jgi:hypothetical protein
MAEGNITVDVLNMDIALRMKTALSDLIDAASNYVKPRRTTDARQVLLEKLDAARAALAQRADEPVAWCSLTASGKVAYFDGKPMVMVGPAGNEHHKTPLYTAAPAAPAYVQLSSQEMQDAIIDWDPITSTEKLRFARHIESLVVARMRGGPKPDA